MLFIVCVSLSACVSQKKYTAVQQQLQSKEKAHDQLALELRNSQESIKELNSNLLNNQNELLVCNTKLSNEQSKVLSLEKQMAYYQNTNDNLLDRLSDLSVVSKSGAESIQRSLQALNEQNRYIKDLTSSMQRKDSLNLVLVMNLKRSLADINDEDVTVEVKKGVVYISLSDKMLFKSGSYTITPQAEEVLGKIAKVLIDHRQLDILVEGHTDNVPIATECMVDNWDLSVKRATSVVRLLQTKFGVKPERMTAGGRAEFIPKAANDNVQGKSLNRRTEIIILPKLDEFFQLLDPPTAVLEPKN